MKKVSTLITVLLLLAGIASAQTAIYVDASMPVSGTGTSWSTAYKTLSEALIIANTTPTSTKYIINIAQGTYYPTGLQNSAARDSAYIITRGGIALYGGYPSGGGTRNVSVNPTLLSGNIGSTTLNTDNSYNILLAVNIPATSDSLILDGLTFTGGRADVAVNRTVNGTAIDTRNGSAISCINIKNKMLVKDCSFTGNYSTQYGGALYLSNSYTDIVNSSLAGNTSAQLGGAIYSQPGSYFHLTNTTFTNNTADVGGGIFSGGAGATGNLATSFITGCTFTNNNANGTVGYGGGMHESNIAHAPTRITNTTFSGNTAKAGAGLFISLDDNSDTSSLRNCTFTNNHATLYGGGLHCVTSVAFGVYGSMFSGNSAGDGGGIYNGLTAFNYPDRTMSIIHCTFTNDSADNGGGVYTTGVAAIEHTKFFSNKARNGGGIYSDHSPSLHLTNDTISGNSATHNGGGVYTKGKDIGQDHYYINSLFSGNKALGYGGALCDSASGAFLENCTFAGDTAAIANGVYCQRPFPTFLNTIVWDGEGRSVISATTQNFYLYFFNSTVQGGFTTYRNDTLNPKFIAPLPASAAPATGGDYRLQSCSPSINTGLMQGDYTGVTDLQGNARVYYETVDRGAYEYSGAYLTPVTGSNVLCKGSTTLLSNATTGGAWASSDTNIAVVTPQTGLVTSRTGGEVEIRYRVTDLSGCSQTSTHLVTVDAGPRIGAIAGDSVLCLSSTAQLHADLAGGIWSSNNPGIALINSTTGKITPVAIGTASITYKATTVNGCTDSVHKTIHIVNSFSYDQQVTICPGTTYQFGTRILRAGGIYLGTFPGAAGCDSVVTLLLNVQQPMDKRVSQNGTTLTSVMYLFADVLFQWIDCDNDHARIPGATNATFSPTKDGTYAVIVNHNGCIDSTDCIEVYGVGIAPVIMNSDAVQVYPNPATDQITVRTNNFAAGSIAIRDITGRLLQEVTPGGKAGTTLSLTGYPAGSYLIEVSDGKAMVRRRITVIR